jgi:hypothetical protein
MPNGPRLFIRARKPGFHRRPDRKIPKFSSASSAICGFSRAAMPEEKWSNSQIPQQLPLFM